MLEFISKFPPSCGVVSSTILLIPPGGRLVKFAPLIAGKTAGNLASGIVPDNKSVASSAPSNEVEVVTPIAVIPPARTLIPVLAVTPPTESIFVTSS